MNVIRSIEDKYQTDYKEKQHRQMAKPPNITFLISASESEININYRVACVKSLHEFKKFYTKFYMKASIITSRD